MTLTLHNLGGRLRFGRSPFLPGFHSGPSWSAIPAPCRGVRKDVYRGAWNSGADSYLRPWHPTGSSDGPGAGRFRTRLVRQGGPESGPK
jgi:hypothetical protein